jgi:hypothetical protein
MKEKRTNDKTAWFFLLFLLTASAILGFGLAMLINPFSSNIHFNLSMDDNTAKSIEVMEQITLAQEQNKCLLTCSDLTYYFNISINCNNYCKELQDGGRE